MELQWSFSGTIQEFDGALECTDHVEYLGVQEHHGVIRQEFVGVNLSNTFGAVIVEDVYGGSQVIWGRSWGVAAYVDWRGVSLDMSEGDSDSDSIPGEMLWITSVTFGKGDYGTVISTAEVEDSSAYANSLSGWRS